MLPVLLVLSGVGMVRASEPASVPWGPLKIWTSKGWEPVPGNSDYLVGGGSSRPPAGPSQAQLAAQAARERREKASEFNAAGLAAWDRSEWGIAAEQFRQAYMWNPDSKVIFNNLVSALVQRGNVALKAGDWNYAETTFQSLTYHKPAVKEYQDLHTYARQKAEDARNAVTINDRGRAAADRNDLSAAESYFRTASEMNPAEPIYRRNLGQIRTDLGSEAWNKGNFEQALKFWESALAADPANEQAGKNVPIARNYIAEKAKDKAAVTRVQGDLGSLAGQMQVPKTTTGGLQLGDFDPTGGPFGTPVVRVTLASVAAPVPGTVIRAGDQLLSAVAVGRAEGDLRVNYDVGGAPNAGSLPVVAITGGNSGVDLSGYSEKARRDPQVVKLVQSLTVLQAKRSQLETERIRLEAERKVAKDPVQMQELTARVTAKSEEYQASLVEISQQTEEVEKRHRQIDTEIESPAGN